MSMKYKIRIDVVRYCDIRFVVLIYLTSNLCLFQINFEPSVFYYMCFMVCYVLHGVPYFQYGTEIPTAFFPQQEFSGLVFDVVICCSVCIIVINVIIIVFVLRGICCMVYIISIVIIIVFDIVICNVLYGLYYYYYCHYYCLFNV